MYIYIYIYIYRPRSSATGPCAAPPWPGRPPRWSNNDNNDQTNVKYK